ncbi:MAG TPA: TonB-dependent receptor [Chryseolinea sp.]
MRILLSLLFMLPAQLFGQVKITGQITDAAGEAIPGVNVFLTGTYDGASTDASGRFSFDTHEQGKRLLVARFIGYKEFAQEIEIKNESFVLTIKLVESINELQAVTITAGAFTASDAARRTVFRAIDIATTAGATADIAGALNTLPGTQKVGESGRLFVRGGDGNETRTFIDGLVVLDAYGPSAPNTPSRGRFLPFMFKGTSFSTGGYSAEYGQALSSALVLDSKDKGELTRTDFGILSVGGDVGHTQVWERGSLGGKVQYTNLRPYVGLIDQEVDWQHAPVSTEASAALRQEVGKHGLFKFYGNFNRSNFSLYQHSIDHPGQKVRYELTNEYQYVNGFYKSRLNDNWSAYGGVSFTSIGDKSLVEHTAVDELQNSLHLKAVADGSLSDHVQLKSGIELIHRNYDQTFKPDAREIPYSFSEVISAAFMEADLYASNHFVVRGGGRFEHANLTQQISVDPRLSLAYKVGGDAQISLAYGKFRQTAKNEFVKIDPLLDQEKATHYIFNYQFIKDKRTFRIETYYKLYEDLIKYSDAANLTNEGNGHAKGVELFWRDNQSISGLDYWVSYSYLNTKRNYLDFPHEATPAFASRHNVSVVAKYFVQNIKSQLGVTYSFTSGRPYNDPNTSSFNQSMTPNYADVSFNWSYLPTTSVIVYFSCTNVLGRDNIFGYEYSRIPSADGSFNGRAIRQPAPRFLFIGIFITLSKDKSINQLPSL